MLASWVIGLIDIRLKQLGIFFLKEEDTYFDITKHLNIFFCFIIWKYGLWAFYQKHDRP